MNQTRAFNPWTGRDETPERVSFTCPGCGRDTVFHVGGGAFLGEKRCLNCRGTARTGRASAPPQRGRLGTHMGSLKTAERRAIKRAAASRNASRRGGIWLSNKTTARASCRSYDTCNHAKHGVPKKDR